MINKLGKTRAADASTKPAAARTPQKQIVTGEAPKRGRRLAPEDREQRIVQAAIQLFARHGFTASTRDLAKAMGITQPLLYRYFPTKEALVDRVYDEVFVRRWNPEWEEWLADRSFSLGDRLKRYLNDYARFILRGEWVRIFMYSGLSRSGINEKYLSRLRERHFLVIAREMRHEFDIPDPRNAEEEEEEVELVWAMHSGVFYIGVRKWIYGEKPPKNLERLINMRVDAFLLGVPAVLKAERAET